MNKHEQRELGVCAYFWKRSCRRDNELSLNARAVGLFVTRDGGPGNGTLSTSG